MNNIHIFAVSFLLASFAGCSGSSLPVGDEARGRLSEVERTRTEQNQRIANQETELTKAREENRRLQAELAAAEGGKGLELEEKQRMLDSRRAGLESLEDQLSSRETLIIGREEKLVQQENEFYRKTNDTMVDIGEAQHVKAEYETMRQEKDDAVATAEFWLMFVWGVSIAFAVALLAIVVLLYRSVSMHAMQRREVEHRQQVADLLSTSIAARLPASDAAAVADAFDRLVRLENTTQSVQPSEGA
jgi:Flp pilus assembly protein TadB